MRKDLETILAELTPTELTALRNHLSYQATRSAVVTYSFREELFWTVCNEVLGAYNLNKETASLAAFVAGSKFGRVNYQKTIEAYDNLIDSATPRNSASVSVVDRKVYYTKLAEAMCFYMISRRIYCDMVSLWGNSGRLLSTAVSRAYPGLISGRRLFLLLERVYHDNDA